MHFAQTEMDFTESKVKEEKKEFKFIVVNDYQIAKFSSLIWHPPKC